MPPVRSSDGLPDNRDLKLEVIAVKIRPANHAEKR